jgi:hypothetical protein
MIVIKREAVKVYFAAILRATSIEPDQVSGKGGGADG